MPDAHGYPTEEELKALRNYEGSFEGFLDIIRECWHFPEWGFKVKGKNVIRIELHTGGWSGNEDIIYELQNTYFWFFFWFESKRGGHYYFRVESKLAKGIKDWGRIGKKKKK